ncbi:MAG: exopolyphosphatase [Pseudomonadota bacterium]
MPRAPSRGQGDLFSDPGAALPRSFSPLRPGNDRIGVVDVGSNSVRMVVFESQRRCPSMIFNEKVMCGLGEDLAQTGRLSVRGKQRAMTALSRFVSLAPGLKIGALAGIATAAVRDATDGTEFRDHVERETGIRLKIASGADEARLAAQGVLFGDPNASGLVMDLGGASLEICPVAKGKPGEGITSPLGPLRVGGDGDRAATRSTVDRVLQPFAQQFGRTDRIYLVGGAWRAFARVLIHLSGHPLNILHEYNFTPEAAREAARHIVQADPATLRKTPGLPSSRIGSAPYAGLLIEALIDHFDPRDLRISGFGLREGVCFDHLPLSVRRQDPLISTCMGQEKTRARDYGFGGELASWVLAALQPDDAEEARLIRAVCHLSDVSWRAHPDFRATGCSEVVTRVNVSSAGHHGRARMMAMLLCRYKGGRKAMAEAPAMALLSEKERERAQQIGALLRLGCTISGAIKGELSRIPLRMTETALVLAPNTAAMAVMGEEVDKRLMQAARAFGLDHQIIPSRD